jgi:hypothetical protein
LSGGPSERGQDAILKRLQLFCFLRALQWLPAEEMKATMLWCFKIRVISPSIKWTLTQTQPQSAADAAAFSFTIVQLQDQTVQPERYV